MSRRYFPEKIICNASGQLKDQLLFGPDFPLIPLDKWMKGFMPAMHAPILWENALNLLCGKEAA